MEKARQWIENNGSYSEGVQLLELLGGKVKPYIPYLTTMFVPPEMKNKLREEIQRLLPEIPTTTTKRPTDEPEVITIYREKGRRLLKMQANLHSKMKVAETDTERYRYAEELMEDIIPEIDRVYDALRDFEQHHIVPASPEVDAVRIATKKLIREKYLRDRLIRVRRFLKTGMSETKALTDEEKAEYEKELLEKTAELEALRIELGINKEVSDVSEQE